MLIKELAQDKTFWHLPNDQELIWLPMYILYRDGTTPMMYCNNNVSNVCIDTAKVVMIHQYNIDALLCINQ